MLQVWGHLAANWTYDRDRVTGHYCPVLDKNWVNDWNKYEDCDIVKHNHLIEVEVATSPQVIIESRNLRGKSIKYTEKVQEI